MPDPYDPYGYNLYRVTADWNLPLYPLGEHEWKALRAALDDEYDDTVSATDLSAAGVQTEWLWEGLIPRDGVALLSAAPKAGKSTLLRGLLRAMHACEDSGDFGVKFLGRAVGPYRAIVVSEEPRAAWVEFDPRTRVRYIVHPPIRKASEWDSYIADLPRLLGTHRADLLVLDSLSRLVGANENSPTAMTRVFAPIRQMAAEFHKSVLVTHHNNRQGGVRGSGAIEAQADEVLTLTTVDGVADPRRVITTVGRLSRWASTVEYQLLVDGRLVLSSEVQASAPATVDAKTGRRINRG